MNKNMKNFIILMYKLLLYGLLFAVFFGVFSLRNIGLVHVSRTMVITMMTFLVFGIGMLSVYGNFQIGEQKSKPIFYSMMLAVFMTDIITYLQLMIMNTNPNNNIIFKLQDLDLLLFVFLVQIALIWIFAYMGNHLYFKMFKALKTVVVYDQNEQATNKILHMIGRYKLQYDLMACMSAYDNDLYDTIIKADYVVLMDMSEQRRAEISAVCYENRINFSFMSNLNTVVEHSGTSIIYDDIPMIEVKLDGLTVEQKIFKRLLDIVVSTIILIVTSPIMLIVAVAIKFEDRGSIFFVQERYTKDHKIFKVIKFRSMKENVENYSATKNDNRITKVGRFIRKTRIDELPQLINIFLGQMSLVGPRPEMLENVHKYEKELPEFKYRLRVKGGLTGIAQIEGKYNTSPEDKLLMDLTYIENYSLLNDLKILFRTLIVLFKKDSTEAFEKDE